MFKMVLIAALLFFSSLGTHAFAHSHLEYSSPKNGEATTHLLADEKAPQAELPKKLENEQPSLKSYLVPSSIGLLMFIAFGSYWLFFRKKHVNG
ncbi:hypothetical protein RCG23_08500 [Neobacillus sp. PS3-34]|uniref:hypothetical protein n=1 Tax=Neobacillus sp. PS3-34 TaxID=3070678 RepID=UPI0027DEB956|nr:hypothetical protein [Neobacillus sp. PS3-34]WML49899.1 hypothetical protein RCG23_08500 [Neobacillus sp. PS3-34]